MGRRDTFQPPAVREPERVTPEVMSKEGAEALRTFKNLFFGELGQLDIERVDDVLEKLQEHDVDFDFSDEHVASRLADEIKSLLGWKPKSDEPPTWIGFNKDDVPEGSAGNRMVVRAGRAMMSALARSIPKPQDIKRLSVVVGFAKEHNVEIDSKDEELVGVINGALFNHKYAGDLFDFVDVADELGVELRPMTLSYAIEDDISNTFGGVHGISEQELERAEKLIDFSKEREVELKLNKNRVFERELLRGIALHLNSENFEGAQKVFDFCKKHDIEVDVRSPETSLRSGSISRILRDIGHGARSRLSLPLLETVLEFSKKNGIDPDLPAEMIGRWRKQIPELVRKRDERSKWQF